MPSSLRLFVALYPPEAVAARLLSAAGALELPPHRLVPVEQVHVTVQFIGDTPVRDVDRTAESVQRAAAGLDRFTLTPERLLSLPERGPRRLVAVRTDGPAALLELERRLVTRLARPRPAGRKRPYLPHLTVLRFRSPSAGARIDEPLTAAAGPLAFGVEEVALMKSTLRPTGAVHEMLEAIPLGRA